MFTVIVDTNKTKATFQRNSQEEARSLFNSKVVSATTLKGSRVIQLMEGNLLLQEVKITTRHFG